ncbi:MAG TPA: hypothetical protein VFS43_47240 [Polyangiaceae bacterium]|nr:hypothetical protein [Polyangiaceae bacterium]
MKISELMTRDVRTCGLGDSLEAAARIVWAAERGGVPGPSGESVVGTPAATVEPGVRAGAEPRGARAAP